MDEEMLVSSMNNGAQFGKKKWTQFRNLLDQAQATLLTHAKQSRQRHNDRSLYEEFSIGVGCHPL
jgi:hypothetical protein